MDKIMPAIIMLVMTAMLFISWKNVLNYNDDIMADYYRHISAAENYLKKEIYIDAVKEYESALAIDPHNYELAMDIAELYEKLEMEGSIMDAYVNAKKADPSQLEPYIILADSYIESGNYSDAYDILTEADENIPDSDEVLKRIIQIKSRYNEKSFSFEEFDGWHYADEASTGYAVVKKDEKYGLIDSSGTAAIPCEYEAIGPLANELIPVKKDGEFFYINPDGYRKRVPDRKADYLGCFGNGGYAPAKIDGVYGYLDSEMKEFHFEYDYAGGFSNGISAVQKGNKWAVIDTSFKNVTDYEFDEILLDNYGFCSVYGVFWAKKDGLYFLYDINGKKLSDGYENVKLFASKKPSAVCKGEKWGFVDISGKLVIEPSYENADSFSLGYAPFEKNGKWGCIDLKQNVIIKPAFSSLTSFDRNGCAVFTDERGTYFMETEIF